MITVHTSDNWRVDMAVNADEVQRYSKHSAWCTKRDGYAADYLYSGKLYALKKKGRRRYSYQLYCNNSVIEIEHKDGSDVALSDFMDGEGAEIADFIKMVAKDAMDNRKRLEEQREAQIKAGTLAKSARCCL